MSWLVLWLRIFYYSIHLISNSLKFKWIFFNKCSSIDSWFFLITGHRSRICRRTIESMEWIWTRIPQLETVFELAQKKTRNTSWFHRSRGPSRPSSSSRTVWKSITSGGVFPFECIAIPWGRSSLGPVSSWKLRALLLRWNRICWSLRWNHSWIFVEKELIINFNRLRSAFFKIVLCS